MIGRFLTAATIFSSAVISSGPVAAEPLRLYIDADYSISHEAAEAIELGVRTALREAGSTLGGVPIDILPRDHRANVKRSHKTLRSFLKDEQGLAVIGGMHSPPYLTHKDYINENRILTLLPWSAAGPITRPAGTDENWIFRLSVDDSKAGRFLVEQAVNEGGCGRIALILVDTGWGRANLKTMTASLAELGETASYHKLFATTLGEEGARSIASEVAASQSDCVIMLALATEGAYLTHALHARLEGVKIFSHWAILGREYPKAVDDQVRRDVGLRVLQTCGLKLEREGRGTIRTALQNASIDLSSLADVPATTGFVHGYDLTRLLIAAAEQASKTPEWSGSIRDKRAALKTALEALQSPVDGILRTYVQPFAEYRADRPDAHEALGANDLCMAAFRQDGRLEDASHIR